MLKGSDTVAGALEVIERLDPLTLTGGEGLTELMLTGNYPVLTWTPFVIAGIALGRLDLQRPRVAIALAGSVASLLSSHTAPHGFWTRRSTGRRNLFLRAPDAAGLGFDS